MRRVLSGLLVLLACIVLLPATVSAQGSAFGGASIAGVVKDTSGAVLPGVLVEAASPALIEKVRSSVTDSSGLYKIVDLRPGTYTVTFTLTGFNSYRRGGLELEGTAVVTVNADLKVGAIEETVTVTGETPIVDLQTTTRERVLSKEVIDALPTSRLYYSLGVLVPGVSASSRDVGGAAGSLFQTTLTAHGSSGNDQRIMINGLNLGAINVGNISNVVPNTGAAQEVQIDTAAAAAERQTGGVVVNFLPKDGGNTLRGNVFATGATENMQASNFTQSLSDLGATASPSKFKETWDFNPGIGGPIQKDTIWFYYTFRAQGAQNKTDMFYNLNEFDPSAWTYVANPSRPALSQHGTWKDNNLRLTWQVNARNKVAGTFSDQVKCSCPNGVSATQSPEAALDQRNPVQRTIQAEWWSPLTNRVLVEFVAQARSVRFMNRDLQPTENGGSLVVTPAQYALYPSLIGVTQTNGGGIVANGLSFHGPNTTSDTNYRPAYSYRASVSYVTGAHAFKVGMQDTFGYNSVETYLVTRDTLNRPVRYRFASPCVPSGVACAAGTGPDQVTVYNTPTFTRNDQNHDFGLFVQDRWTRSRLTLNLGARYDWYVSSYPDQLLPASTNGRPQTQFSAGENLNWKDVTPRMGAAYDLQGDGKTAVKISLNKYVANQALGGLGISANPLSTGNGIVANWNRNWNDANGNKVVDCNVDAAGANGECTNAIAASVLNVTPNPRLDQGGIL